MFAFNPSRIPRAAIITTFLLLITCAGCETDAPPVATDEHNTPPTNGPAKPENVQTSTSTVIIVPAAKPPVNANGPTLFPTPERAVEALTAAAKNSDTPAMLSIFGPEGRDILSSGDTVADKRAREVFVTAMAQRWKLEGADPARRELVIGNEQWPFPIPIVRQGEAWRFDSDAGKQEVRARRIGRNELAAIGICETYVIAQKKYASEARDNCPAGCFAEKVRSTSGKHDGLFWPTKLGEKHSPLGDLAAKAASEGYTANNTAAEGTQPLRGYFFRILTQQGATASGGAKNYIVNGHMTGGYALIAYPAEYGNSGIMTFIVNQDGVVQEADLGADTAKAAAAITAYDPGERFHPVD